MNILVAIISGNPGITTPAIVEMSPWCDDTTRLALKAAERLRLVSRRIGLRRIEHWEVM